MHENLVSDSKVVNFPIVGIGASAGGLEAFEQFLGNVSENCGMAFVIIQHLDPTQKGMLPELLQRITPMNVYQAKDRMTVEQNCVYVIPPNKSLSISKGILHLHKPIEERGLRLPVDYFFRSLADDRHERCIGIILSGMGSDGCLGVRAIKERNGIVMVQEPATAKFDSMPRNAIDSVLVDVVAPAKELPARLQDFFKRIPLIQSDLEIEIQDKQTLEKIIALLRIHTGNDFSLYKKNTLYRRIERRMAVHKIDSVSAYALFMKENPSETTFLFKELLIGVTNFFRDAAVWNELKDEYLPELLSKQPTGSKLRAWIPGCSTGEEAYSLAILFKEALKKTNPHGGISLQIFATDLDNESIEIARKGVYPENITNDVSQTRLNRFFTKTDEGYLVNAEIREMIVFAQHNIIMHPSFTKLDIVSCRNLLIYLDAELQKKIIGLFYYSLHADGLMILGNSESIGTHNQLFETKDTKLKIYRRTSSNLKRTMLDFPSSFSRPKPTEFEMPAPGDPTLNIEMLSNQLLLQHFSPPGVLVNENGDIIYISGRTGKYLEPAVGKANLNIFAMLRDGLRKEFPTAFHKAVNLKETIVLNNINVGTNGGTQCITVTIQWIDKPSALKGMIMIIFKDTPDGTKIKPSAKNGKKPLKVLQESAMEEELNRTREDMQRTFEEMQTSQEELKSANEELQSTNEELQSTNEELTSSKEEMQSLNEELQTVNAELQTKVDDFSRVSNDMKNLLNSTEIATLFLDKELKIRRFTNQATKIFKLIKSDVGRPLSDLVSDLIYAGLTDDAQEVLTTLSFIKKQIPTKDGRWFSVRIMPYRTFDDKIDGVVITFFNISDLKKLEAELHETDLIHGLILNSYADVVLRISCDLTIQDFNLEAESLFGKKHNEVLNKSFIPLFIPVTNQKKTEKELKKILQEKLNVNYTMQILNASGEKAFIECNIQPLLNHQDTPSGLLIISKKETKP